MAPPTSTVERFRGQALQGGLIPAVPLVLRLAVAAATLVWGTTKRRPVVLPLVVLLAQPDWQPWMFGYLAAVPRLQASQAMVQATAQE